MVVKTVEADILELRMALLHCTSADGQGVVDNDWTEGATMHFGLYDHVVTEYGTYSAHVEERHDDLGQRQPPAPGSVQVYRARRRERYHEVGPPRTIMNLITKTDYAVPAVLHPDAYAVLRAALRRAAKLCRALNIKRVALPHNLSCGFNGMDWHYVRGYVEEAFSGPQVDAFICRRQYEPLPCPVRGAVHRG